MKKFSVFLLTAVLCFFSACVSYADVVVPDNYSFLEPSSVGVLARRSASEVNNWNFSPCTSSVLANGATVWGWPKNFTATDYLIFEIKFDSPVTFYFQNNYNSSPKDMQVLGLLSNIYYAAQYAIIDEGISLTSSSQFRMNKSSFEVSDTLSEIFSNPCAYQLTTYSSSYQGSRTSDTWYLYVDFSVSASASSVPPDVLNLWIGYLGPIGSYNNLYTYLKNNPLKGLDWGDLTPPTDVEILQSRVDVLENRVDELSSRVDVGFSSLGDQLSKFSSDTDRNFLIPTQL